MKTLKEVAELCISAIPKKETWKHSLGESYGAYNFNHKNDSNVVEKALYCVTPSSEIIDYAKRNNYDLLIGHHPFALPGMPLLIFHTALDMCDGGLNWHFLDHFKIKNAIKYEDNLGWYGEIEPVSFDELLAKTNDFVDGQKIIGQLKKTDKKIRTILTCSGLGGFVERQAQAKNPDCFITGQLISNVEGLTIESIIETGHTLSEQCGVKTFQKILSPYGIQVDLAPITMDCFGNEVW